ncbi:hypothetical protein HPB52_023375 [Rhipicephalus sanguineus]|uniref:Uncharacterized protein n=1 Tax=Rhipicephalus sanguineus TaxID=34632 RepID=A0A9D4QFQ4_RHISA|nr:hypothetical protein HPB52_023375 [Rhipicephalus sanguineus]
MSSSESILSDQPQAHLLTSRQSSAECVAWASLKKSMAAEDTFIEHLPVLSGSASRGIAEVIDAPPEDGASIDPSGRLACDSTDDDGQFSLTASVKHECRTDHHKAVCAYGGPDAHRSDGRGREHLESIFVSCSYGTGECGGGRAEATASNHEGQVSQHDQTRKHASLEKYVSAQSADMHKHALERSTEQRRRNLMWHTTFMLVKFFMPFVILEGQLKCLWELLSFQATTVLAAFKSGCLPTRDVRSEVG